MYNKPPSTSLQNISFLFLSLSSYSFQWPSSVYCRENYYRHCAATGSKVVLQFGEVLSSHLVQSSTTSNGKSEKLNSVKHASLLGRHLVSERRNLDEQWSSLHDVYLRLTCELLPSHSTWMDSTASVTKLLEHYYKHSRHLTHWHTCHLSPCGNGNWSK